jgi:hypothetical protein
MVLTLQSELSRVNPNKLQDNKILPLPDVTRVEVVDTQGRAYARSVPNAAWSMLVKDDGKTLVVLIDPRWKD